MEAGELLGVTVGVIVVVLVMDGLVVHWVKISVVNRWDRVTGIVSVLVLTVSSLVIIRRAVTRVIIRGVLATWEVSASISVLILGLVSLIVVGRAVARVVVGWILAAGEVGTGITILILSLVGLIVVR